MISMPGNVCKFCGIATATDAGFWNLCSDCYQFHIAFLDWLRHYPNLNVNDIQGLKGSIENEIRKGATKNEILATLVSIVQP